LTKNADYIDELIDLLNNKKKNNNNNHDNIIAKLTSKNQFMELFFVTFYAANSLMKLAYWKENLSIHQACELYSRLIKEYTGFEMPGEYWLLHHILPESIMYVPSYLLAAVRAAELSAYMKDKFGDKWWNKKQSGKNLREIMGPGASIDLSVFSKLDSSVFFKRDNTKIPDPNNK
jgi:hypothetical protein